MKKPIFLSFLLIHVLLASAQEAELEKADKDFENAEYESALDNYEQAGERFYAQGKTSEYVDCNLKKAQCHLRLGEPQSSLIIAESAIDFVESGASNQKSALASAKMISGEAYLNMGRNDLAIEYLTDASNELIEGSLAVAECYENLGIAYANNANRELALQFHERALKIREDYSSEDKVLIADSYMNIGRLDLIDAPKKSIKYIDDAIAVYKAELGKTHPKVAYANANLAYAYAELEEFSDALNFVSLVEGIWEATFEGDHPNKAYTLSDRGRILELKGDLDESLIYQQEALKMYHRLHGDKHPDLANVYFLIGKVYQKKGEFQLAAESYQQSVYANLINQNFETIYDIPEARDYFSADILLTSLQALAKSMEALHFEKTLKKRDLDCAVQNYVVCDELITQIRQLRLSESDKLRLGQVASEVYENGINLSVFLSERTFSKKEYLELAFNFCERSKSAILLEAINETNAKSFAGIPAESLRLEDSLKNEISYLELRLTQLEDDQQLEEAKEDLFQYQTALREYVSGLEQSYPYYYRLKYDQKLVKSSELIEAVPQHLGVLSYFTGKETIYVFLLSNKGLKVFPIPKLDNFNRLAVGLRNAIRYHHDDHIEELAIKLYDQLIPRMNTKLTDLIVIPDGVLGMVPFEVLATKEKDEKSRYLIEDYHVSYDYSATLLSDRLKMESVQSTEGILLTAPVLFRKYGLGLNDLPGSEKEIKEIKYLFQGDSRKATIAAKSDATEQLLKSPQLSEYKYLHFATHGQVNESQPELSRIFLTPSEDEDGSLFCSEIYNLKLNADLVALSACETGLGKIAKGEGIVGLSRALMYAGAENIIVSLWPVADESTANLMIEFYKQHLFHSENNLFSDDLRKAKLSLLRSEEYNQPYYWAPFILVGL